MWCNTCVHYVTEHLKLLVLMLLKTCAIIVSDIQLVQYNVIQSELE